MFLEVGILTSLWTQEKVGIFGVKDEIFLRRVYLNSVQKSGNGRKIIIADVDPVRPNSIAIQTRFKNNNKNEVTAAVIGPD